MSRITSQYPERVYATSTEEKRQNFMERMNSKGTGRMWLIGGLAILGLLAVYKFGPDFVRYVKMERM
jgi:hypothetical protein